MAASGAAIGLGNIWRFPYLAGESGGGAFLLIYVALALTVGLAVIMAEIAIGRAAQRNPVGAYVRLGGRSWGVAGYLGVAVCVLIMSFYSVVGGWAMAYAADTMRGALGGISLDQLGDRFGGFTSSAALPLLYHAAFIVLTVLIVSGGVRAGIERWCRVLMPVLFIMILILAVRSISLPGASAGLAFLFAPDFSRVDGAVLIRALSQAFFSLGAGAAMLLTYGSYLEKEVNLSGSTLWIAILDTAVAIVAGMAVLPAVFAFGHDPAGGPGLAFVTLSAIFNTMPAGLFFGTVFFVLLVIAALTSAVSLVETPVSYLVDEWRMGQRRATALVGAVIFVLGIPVSLSLGVWSGFHIGGLNLFDAVDFLTAQIMLPVGGILALLFVGWRAWPAMAREVAGDPDSWSGARRAMLAAWRIMCRYIGPLAVVLIMAAQFLGWA